MRPEPEEPRVAGAGLDELRTLALEAAEEGGLRALKRRRAGVRALASKSAPEDIVTEADRETETLIRSAIQRARPNDGFLGEETGHQPGTSGLTWIVDPIDGTTNYLYDLPFWAVSVAVVEGDPDPATWIGLAGAVVIPPLRESYSAADGSGAVLNGQPIRAVEAPSLALSLVGTGFTYSAEKRSGQGQILARLISSVRDIRRSGSAAADLCSVAKGRLNAYYESYVNPWDHAAGAVIAREAGAKVGGFDGARESSNLLIAAPPKTYQLLEELLTSKDIARFLPSAPF